MSKNIQQKAKGKITISRWTSNGSQKDGISIEITDETSGTRFLSLEMSIEDFGMAITGMSLVDCEFELRAKNVGKIRESKTITVPMLTKGYDYTDAIKAESLAPFEIDGWKGYTGDLGNHHNSAGNNAEGWPCFRVGFSRFMSAKKESA